MMDRDTMFAHVEARALAATMTIAELCEKADVSRATYWRARKGHQKRVDSFIPTIRKLETTLDAIEAGG